MNDFDFDKKVVGVRIDINSPIKGGKVILNERIVKSCETINELADKGAKVVLLAHQGRKGKSDFVSLKEHSKLLSKELGKKVDFLSFLDLDKVLKKTSSMKFGEILLLENLRFFDDEADLKKKDNLILKLEDIFDIYIFDAFSVSHRAQTSVVGFKKIPVLSGRLMEKEILGLNNILETKRPRVYFFGGAKPDDLIEMLEIVLKKNKVDIVLLGGIIGEVALKIKGYYLGKKFDFLKEHHDLDSEKKLRILLEKYSQKFVLPKDVALSNGKNRIEIRVEDLQNNKELLDKYLIQDIGLKTVQFYSHIISNASSIYVKGPAGNFEENFFEFGTNKLFNLISSSSSFSFMGGGHSVTAAQSFNCLEKFSYVSLAGGALVKFLSGKKLVGVENLENSFRIFGDDRFSDYIVIGSNVLDTGVIIPKEFGEISLGDKIRIEDNFLNSVGGGGINTSVCISKLGGKVSYLGKLSYENKEVIKEICRVNKIRLIDSKLTRKPCAKSILIDTKDEDRLILTHRGQNSDLKFEDFDIKNFRGNFYYLSSLMDESFNTQLKLVKAIKKRNKKAIFCYNTSSYLIRNEKKIKDLIKLIDVLVLNYDEAQELVGEGSISVCLKRLFKIESGIILITDGSRGAYCYDGTKEYFTSSVKPKKVVDTTGAGDCFASTFFYFFSKNYSINDSLKLAAKNSSSVVSKKGTQAGLLEFNEL